MPLADAGALGRALAKLRVAQHLTQEDVARRVSTYYSEAGSYGRVERGQRHPDRDPLIAILTHGLSVSDLGEVNHILGLADYEGLTEQEVGQLGLSLSRSAEQEVAALAHSELFDGSGRLKEDRSAIFHCLEKIIYLLAKQI